MDDTFSTFGGFLLRHDSEYLSAFNHYFLKAKETGIFHRLDRWTHNDVLVPPIKSGIREPEPLAIKNVMFPFSCLGVAMIISLVVAIAEKMTAKIKLHFSKSARGSSWK